MPAKRLDGLVVSQLIRRDFRAAVTRGTNAVGRPPCLAVVHVGGDKPSELYVRSKKRTAEACGVRCDIHVLPPTITFEGIKQHIGLLNESDHVDGVIAQLPLPSHINRYDVMAAVAREKDVDGMHPQTVGLGFCSAEPLFVPCTALGVRILLDQYGFSTAGRHAVVVGRGPIAGRSIALALAHGDATVTVCHKQTRDLIAISSTADSCLCDWLRRAHYTSACKAWRCGHRCGYKFHSLWTLGWGCCDRCERNSWSPNARTRGRRANDRRRIVA